jgi:hypothetical protein
MSPNQFAAVFAVIIILIMIVLRLSGRRDKQNVKLPAREVTVEVTHNLERGYIATVTGSVGNVSSKYCDGPLTALRKLRTQCIGTFPFSYFAAVNQEVQTMKAEQEKVLSRPTATREPSYNAAGYEFSKLNVHLSLKDMQDRAYEYAEYIGRGAERSYADGYIGYVMQWGRGEKSAVPPKPMLVNPIIAEVIRTTVKEAFSCPCLSCVAKRRSQVMLWSVPEFGWVSVDGRVRELDALGRPEEFPAA